MTHPIGDPFEHTLPRRREVRASVEIAAAPEAVFRALADPRELVAWLSDVESTDTIGGSPTERAAAGGDEPDAAPLERGERADARDALATYSLGASWLAHVRAPDGTPGTVSGEFLYVVPSRSLHTTWSASWNRFTQQEVTFELAPIEIGGAAGTRVTVIHRQREVMILREATRASARADAPAEDTIWDALLARLSAYVAATNALAHWGAPAVDLTRAFGALHQRVIAIHRGESA